MSIMASRMWGNRTPEEFFVLEFFPNDENRDPHNLRFLDGRRVYHSQINCTACRRTSSQAFHQATREDMMGFIFLELLLLAALVVCYAFRRYAPISDRQV